MNVYLLIAALCAGGVALLHVFVGGPEAARPLLAAKDLGRTAKLTNYYCWHLVSLTLAAMTGCYVVAAFRPETIELAVLATLLAVAFAIWSVGLALGKQHSLLKLPQWMLFATVAVFGVLGLLP